MKKTPHILKQLLPTSSFFLGSTPLLIICTSPYQRSKRTGTGSCNEFVTCCLCHSFLFSGRTAHALLLHGVPPAADSPPQTSPIQILSPVCSSSQTAPARVPCRVTSPAGKSAPVWAPLSTRP